MDEPDKDSVRNYLKTGAAGLMSRWQQSSVSAARRGNDEQSLHSLRPSSNALLDRLDEVLVLELMKDGSRGYLYLSARSLYKHVMAVITNLHSVAAASLVPPPTANSQSSTPLSTVCEEGPVVSGDHPSGDQSGNHSSGRQAHDRHSSPKKQHAAEWPSTHDQPPPSAAENSSGGNDSGDSSVTSVEVNYRQLLGGYLHPRDMRKLIMPFSAANEPELMVRRHAILLNFDPLRCIILRDRLLVLVPEGADSILVNVERRVRGGHKELERLLFGSETNMESSEPVASSPVAGNAADSVRSAGAVAMSPATPRKSVVDRLWNFVSQTNSRNSGEDYLASGSLNSKTNRKTRPELRQSTATSEDSWENFGGSVKLEIDETTDDIPLPVEVELAHIAGQEWVELPFELKCLDAVLQTVVSLLSEETCQLQEATQTFINQVLHGSGGNTYISEDPLAMIRAIKDSVRGMMARVKRFVQSMNSVLDDEERMALMNLSRLITHPKRFIQPVSPEVLQEESDEPELILEACLQQSLSVVNVVHLIQGQIDTATELVNQKLDATRNKILLANTIITTAALSGNFLMGVAGLFGMNVINHFEDSETAFVKITFFTLAGTILFFIGIIGILYRTGTIPNWGGLLSKGI